MKNQLSVIYHGTCGKVAERILSEGIKNRMPSPVHCVSAEHHRQRGTKPSNPHYVYLIENILAAISFGYTAAMRSVRHGKYTLSPIQGSQKYDDVVVFGLDAAALSPALVRESHLFHGETAYEGSVPSAAIRFMLQFPMTLELEQLAFLTFSRHPQLRAYKGDIMKLLGGKAFEVQV